MLLSFIALFELIKKSVCHISNNNCLWYERNKVNHFIATRAKIALMNISKSFRKLNRKSKSEKPFGFGNMFWSKVLYQSKQTLIDRLKYASVECSWFRINKGFIWFVFEEKLIHCRSFWFFDFSFNFRYHRK